MVVPGCVHIEASVHQVADIVSLEASFRTLSALSLWLAGLPESQEDRWGRCALHFVSAPVLTLLKKWHEGVCHISHAVDTSASSELKAR